MSGEEMSGPDEAPLPKEFDEAPINIREIARGLLPEQLEELLEEADAAAREEAEAAMRELEEARKQETYDLKDLLDRVGERNGEAAKLLYAWLTNNGFLVRVGEVYDQGYLLMFTDGEDYVAGQTAGDRHVDNALDKVREEAGPVPPRRGLCRNCLSVVQAVGNGRPYSDGDPTRTHCKNNGPHEMAT